MSSKIVVFALICLIATTAWGQQAAQPLGAQAAGPDGMFGNFSPTVEQAGWSQVYDLGEITLFLVDIAATLALASLLVFHPARLTAHRTLQDLQLPRLFLIYAMIGMVVGFLVDQHGYLIGFVVFGIGTLLRFRSTLDDPEDTIDLILVTVLGLCIGLDLPVMAFLIAAAGWVLIWITGRQMAYSLNIKSADRDGYEQAIDAGRTAILSRDWKMSSIQKAPSKNAAELLFFVPRSVGLEELDETFAAVYPDKSVSWKLSS